MFSLDVTWTFCEKKYFQYSVYDWNKYMHVYITKDTFWTTEVIWFHCSRHKEQTTVILSLPHINTRKESNLSGMSVCQQMDSQLGMNKLFEIIASLNYWENVSPFKLKWPLGNTDKSTCMIHWIICTKSSSW